MTACADVLGPMRLRSGRVEADVVIEDPVALAEIILAVDGTALNRAKLEPGKDGQAKRIVADLPTSFISSGRRMLSFVTARDNTLLGELSFFAGSPDETDLVGEVERLRAELELLKAAFRRHVREAHQQD